MTLTIKNIARKAGVSCATVSLALNDDSRVARKTKEKLKRIADELQYVPNNFGRALQSNKSRIVGCLVHSITASFFGEILEGIGKCATANGYGLMSAICPRNAEYINEQLKIFREKRIDGMIVVGSFSNFNAIFEEFEASGIKVVMASVQDGLPGIPKVVTDNRAGGILATEHLLKMGHKNILYASPSGEGNLRYSGYHLAMTKHGLEPIEKSSSLDELAESFRGSSAPSAIVAYSDNYAVKIKHMAEALGLKYPRDYSIVGFDDIWLAALSEFDFTTIAQDRKGIGRISMELLLERVNGGVAEDIILPPRLVVRGSTSQYGI